MGRSVCRHISPGILPGLYLGDRTLFLLILLTSFSSECFSTAGIGQVRAAVCVNATRAVTLIVSLGVVVSHHSAVKKARAFIIRSRSLTGSCGGNTARTHVVAKVNADNPSAGERAHHLWTPTTFGFGALERVPGQSATFCVGRTSRGLFRISALSDRGLCCARERRQATVATGLRAKDRRYTRLHVCAL